MKDRIISCLIDKGLQEKMKAYCLEHDIRQSDLIRKAIRALIVGEAERDLMWKRLITKLAKPE